MRIFHISDIHIKNFKDHDQYEQVFEQFYEKIKELKPDLVINTGDTAHTKLSISPAWVQVTANFYKRVADLCPFHTILGNHDLNLKNIEKLDALSPIVSALNHPSIYLHKYSSVVPIGELDFYVLSIVDPQNWLYPPEKDKRTSVALFHGSVKGVLTDSGWALEEGEYDIETLNRFDYALGGDIHKENQSLDDTGRKRYAGSAIQQGFGETPQKGFLCWDIFSKTEYDCELITFYNPRPFVTIELEDDQLPKSLELDDNSRIRLVSNTAITSDKVREILLEAKQKYRPELVTFVNKSDQNYARENFAFNFDDGLSVRDVSVQETLIRDYLSEYKLDGPTVNKILEINRKLNSVIESTDDIARNVHWSLEEVQWDNLFNYGKGNRINFKKNRGIVGLLSPNSYGKSSAIAAILFTIFNTTDKNERKNLNVINQLCDSASGKIRIAIGSNEYTIERKLEKYNKRLNGDEITEAKVDLNFSRFNPDTCETENLNGLSRNDTEKNIRKIFGTIDDFLLTSMSSQLDSLQFIKEGSTKRKEILAKFLDLEPFDLKFKAAKEESSELKGRLKKLDDRNFEQEIQVLSKTLSDNDSKIKKYQDECKQIKLELEDKDKLKQTLREKLSGIKENVINSVYLKSKEKDILKEIETSETQLRANKTDIESARIEIVKTQALNVGISVEELEKTFQEATLLQKMNQDLLVTIKREKASKDNNSEKTKLLKDIPCGTQYPTCLFIQNAMEAKNKLKSIETQLEQFEKLSKESQSKLEKLNPSKISADIQKYKQNVLKIEQLENKIQLLNLKNANLQLELDSHNLFLKENRKLQDEYERNKEKIEEKASLSFELENTERHIAKLKLKTEECDKQVLVLFKEHGSNEQKLKTVQESQQEYLELAKAYSCYELFLRCMHPNGIAYSIIKNKLPIINEEINKILSSVVGYRITFDADDKQLKVFITEDGYDPRPIEIAGGAEKTMAAIAIRLALLTVSSLPKPDLFILDEPGTALDAENMEGFVNILDLIKSHFRTVLLISHLDNLKDCVNKVITITKNKQFAFINE